MDWLENEIERFFLRFEWSQMEIEWGKRVVWLLIIWLLTLLLAKIFRHFFIPVLQKISHRTKIQWDDHLFKDEVLHKAARIIPPVVWYLFLPVAFKGEPYFLDICLRITQIYLIIVSLMLINAGDGNVVQDFEHERNLAFPPFEGCLPNGGSHIGVHRCDTHYKRTSWQKCDNDTGWSGCFGSHTDVDFQRQYLGTGGRRATVGQ